MSNAPLKLVPRKRKAQEGVRKTFLNMAKVSRSEGFTAVAIVGIDSEGFTHSAFEAGGGTVHLIGGVEVIKGRLLKYLNDD